MFEGFETGGVAGLEGGDFGGDEESFGMEGRPEEVGEDSGVELWFEIVEIELLVFVDERVDSSRVQNVSEHDFAGLKRSFTEA